MAQAIREAKKEYWLPANQEATRVFRPLTTHNRCPRCETEYPIEGRYCHMCGTAREPEPAPAPLTLSQIFDLEVLRERLALSLSSLVFFLLGLGCILGALLTGLVHRVDTALDWESVQVSRIEWLLASVVAMLAAILLKKKTV